MDPVSVLATATATTFVSAAYFTATTALRHSTPSGRVWATGLITAAGVGALATYRELVSAETMLFGAAIAGGATYAIGSLWAGARLFDGGRSTTMPVLLLLTLVSAAAGALGGHAPIGLDLTTLVLGLSWAALSIAAARTFATGSTRINVNSRIMQGLLWIFGTASAVTSSVFVATTMGSDGTPLVHWSVAAVLACLFTISTLCLSALRTERTRPWWTTDPSTPTRAELGVLTTKAFTDDARDRIDRARVVGGRVGLVVVEMCDLEEINVAYGRATGDQSIVNVATTIRTHVPASALIGYLGAGRFAVVSIVSANRPVEAIQAAITTGLLISDLMPELPVRVNCAVGHSAQDGTEHGVDDLDGLLDAAWADARLTQS